MSLLPETKYTQIFTGSTIRAQYLQEVLRDEDINSIIANDGESAARAGFGSSYGFGARLMVNKDDALKAKHIVETIQEHDDELPADPDPNIQKEAVVVDKSVTTPKRSIGNILINVGLIIYSLFRLYPLTQGEELSTLRIAISSIILVVSVIALVMNFRPNKSKA